MFKQNRLYSQRDLLGLNSGELFARPFDSRPLNASIMHSLQYRAFFFISSLLRLAAMGMDLLNSCKIVALLSGSIFVLVEFQ